MLNKSNRHYYVHNFNFTSIWKTLPALLRMALLALGIVAAGSTLESGLAPGPGFFGIGGDGRPRRRRRRRALTASDKADIAFIAGTLGDAAGRKFAMIVAART